MRFHYQDPRREQLLEPKLESDNENEFLVPLEHQKFEACTFPHKREETEGDA